MALGIRGFNPIWAEFDLQGNIFDDTFYMFVLENVLPYIPATVYHDPDLNTPWTQPIQFLANGTLPVDIYFETEHVYRLEFRKGPTQADPLIYEVNNYIPGSGGSTPVDTVAFASSNQVTNPQFAVVSFSSPLALTAITNPDPIEIGQGWFLELAGTGNVSIEQVQLNNLNANPSNASFALHLTLSGWDVGGVFLRQRYNFNGMLWANKTVSTTLTSRVEGAPQSVSANLIDSNGTTLTQVLPSTVVNESWNEFTGYGELGPTTNPDFPGTPGWIEYKLALPSNIEIYVTSIQLVVQDLPIEPSFEQDTIERQIDHMYHNAFPIVPVGTIIDWCGFGAAAHYLDCFGQALDRRLFNQLFQVMTRTEAVTLTNTSTTFTVANGLEYRVGMPIEGVGIQAGTLVANVVGNTITMTLPAVASGPSLVRFFTAPNGDGSTTFNVYDMRGYVSAGFGDTGLLIPANFDGVGVQFGSPTHTIAIAEMPTHDHPGSSVALGIGNQGTNPTGFNTSASFGPTSVTVAPQGGGVPMPIVQPTIIMRKMIRYE